MTDELVKVAYASDEAQAELLQGLLRTAGVGSVLRRSPGFDVPEMLAAGPRDVLVAAADAEIAREVLREVDSYEPTAPAESGADPPRRVIAGVLLAVAVVALVVCVALDVFP
jgi:hypothetical protein